MTSGCPCFLLCHRASSLDLHATMAVAVCKKIKNADEIVHDLELGARTSTKQDLGVAVAVM